MSATDHRNNHAGNHKNRDRKVKTPTLKARDATIEIAIFSDFVCPWCYIGKRRLEIAIAQRNDYNFSLYYFPFQLNPDIAEPGMDRKDYLRTKFGSDTLAEHTYANIRKTAESLDLGFRLQDIAITPNSAKAHILLSYLQHAGYGQEACANFAESLFAAYFCNAQDIGNEAVLHDLWSATELKDLPQVEALLRDADYHRYVAEAQVAATEANIHGVPFYLIAGRHALSGAQEPHNFVSLFDLAAQ